MKNLHNKGFTLVELMIVVAIIGILAAIAVPNYQKYQAKARQAEVKLNLSGAYTAEQSYMVENSAFSGCLGAIGVGVGQGPKEKRYYTFGFDTPAQLTYGNGTSCNSGPNMTLFMATQGANGGPTTTNAGGGSLTATSFTVSASGTIGDKNSTNPTDDWTIDENKSLVNTKSGI